jgi:exodeoxyribonuclease-3
MIRVVSWNVNGIRAVSKKNFFDWLAADQPDLVCIQETKAHPDQVEPTVLEPLGYRSAWRSAKKKGYSGVLTYYKIPPVRETSMGIPEFDDEGRVQLLEYPAFTLVNAYFPNSQPERKRIDYKVEFVKAIIKTCNELRKKGKNILVVGDYNIAHTEIDLARPKENENNPGYYIEEREIMTEFLDAGYVDTFRQFHQGEKGHYSWWSYRAQARERNVGWRIDCTVVNKEFFKKVKASSIQASITGSDHCPIDITLDVKLT